MPLGRYTLLTIPGSAVWAFGIAGIGWALGSNYERFHRAFDITRSVAGSRAPRAVPGSSADAHLDSGRVR